MTQWVWLSCCYNAEVLFPFAFCEDCWVKYGKPRAMCMKQYPKAQEMIDNG